MLGATWNDINAVSSVRKQGSESGGGGALEYENGVPVPTGVRNYRVFRCRIFSEYFGVLTTS